MANSPLCRILRIVACILLWSSMTISGTAQATPRPARAPLPAIRHVFIIVLENKGYATTFGPNSPAPYLAKTLVAQGALLSRYYGIGHASLDNYLAMISGQAPNPATQNDCHTFVDVAPGEPARHGQVKGTGCVYPRSVSTISDQLSTAGLSWKGYMEDMGNDPQREAASCGHPALGTDDRTQRAEAGDQYASRHDPFVYFHSIIDRPDCGDHVVGLAALKQDLRSAAATPNLAFITPNLCHDGHDGAPGRPCVGGEPGGLVSADAFLKEWVPAITESPAFREDGLLIVTFDEADVDVDVDASSGTSKLVGGDASACCHELPGPNITRAARVFGAPDKGPGGFGPGGGRIGAVLLSPMIKPGTVSTRPYNHYALLRGVEDIFGLPHLGFAAQRGLKRFDTDVFTAATP